MGSRVRALLVVLLVTVPVAAAAAVPTAMPDQVPELMRRSILPVTRDVPLCAAIADRPVGETDYLVVGLANGTVNVFHPSGSDMLVRVIELDRHRPVEAVGAMRLTGGRTDFALFAVQGRTLSVMGEAVSRVKATTALPAASGSYALARVREPGGGAERVLLHDSESVFEVRVSSASNPWTVSIEPLLSDERGVWIHELSDRVLIATTDDVREFTAASGLLEPGGEHAGSRASWSRPAIISDGVSPDGARLDVRLRASDGQWVPAGIALDDSLTLTATVWDSMLVIGGALAADKERDVGWITLVDAAGRIVARSEHGRPVAAVATVGEWLAVQGAGRNLSLYGRDLTPVWDNASQVVPLSLLAAHLDADTSEDLVVIGTRRFDVETERVEAIREALDLPDFMRDATEVSNAMVLDRPMLSIHYSNAGELEALMHDRRQLAVDLARSRDYIEAARHAFTARAAAAALGWSDLAEELRVEGLHLLAMPRRERAALVAATILLLVGALSAWMMLMRRPRSRERQDLWALAALFVAGVAAWFLLGRTFWSPALVAGGVAFGFVTVVAWSRAPAIRTRRAGAAVEELELRLQEFTHGGDGSSKQGRKRLTNLAYLLQEMLESIDDTERYEMLRERVALRYKSFHPAKYQLAIDLPGYARVAGVAVRETETVARAAISFHDAMTIVLASDETAERRVAALTDSLAAREALRRSADEAQAIVRKNPGCSVTACIDGLLDERSEVLASMNVEVVRELGLDASVDAVAIQRAQLHFIVENLVTNALRAMDDARERKLLFIGTAHAEIYELRVSDTGSGITEETRREIFIPNESENVTGGWGLPHSREILRRTGGNIVVERTAAGEGTTMLVTLHYWSPVPRAT